MHTTSREAYETAVARNKTAVENVRRAKAMLDAAQDELIAADALLCAQEHSPGVPLYTRQEPRPWPFDVAAGADPLAIPPSRIGDPVPGYDPRGCGRCDATYTELDDSGHCVNSGACGRRRQAAARQTTKAGTS